MGGGGVFFFWKGCFSFLSNKFFKLSLSWFQERGGSAHPSSWRGGGGGGVGGGGRFQETEEDDLSGCWATAAFSPPLLEDPRLAARKYSLDTVAAVTSWLDGAREERSPSVTGETPRRCSGDEQVGESLGSRWEQQAGGNRTRRGLDSDEVREHVETFVWLSGLG